MNNRVKEIFTHLNSIPEPSGQEEKTSAYLASALLKAGFAVKRNLNGGFGLTGTLIGGSDGPVVGVRADMDALTHVVDDKTICVHSCGHDAHCAMVLTMAEKLAILNIKRGSLKIIFQPAEETLKGAKDIIASGEIDDLDYLFGIHLRPLQEAKAGQATPALRHGSSYIAKINIAGRTAHGARPHLGINAIDAAVLLINAISAVKENPVIPWSVKPTMFNSNSVVFNAIPDGARLAFDIRAQDNQTMQNLLQKTTQIIQTVPQTLGATGVLEAMDGCPAAEYDQESINLYAEAITNIMGASALLLPITTPGAEDFHFYKQAKPSIKAGYLGLGANLVPGLHDPSMKFDQDSLINGVKILEYVVNKLLN